MRSWLAGCFTSLKIGSAPAPVTHTGRTATDAVGIRDWAFYFGFLVHNHFVSLDLRLNGYQLCVVFFLQRFC